MPEHERVPDGIPVARAAVDPDEATTDAILRAAKRAHVDVAVDSEDPQLHAQIDADALDRLIAHRESFSSDSDFVVVVELWDRTFVIRPKAVEVYH